MKSLTMRVFISIFTVVLFSMLSPGPSEAAEPIKLVLGSTGVPDVTTWWACEDFVERVARYSNGEIIVEHHGAGALGSDKKLAQSVKLGTKIAIKVRKPSYTPQMVNGSVNGLVALNLNTSMVPVKMLRRPNGSLEMAMDSSFGIIMATELSTIIPK